MKKIIAAALGLMLALTASSQTITGDWNATLNVGVQLPIVLHVEGTTNALTATMDSPAQKALGIPVSSVRLQEGQFSFAIAQLGVSYEGTWTGDTITGVFRQGGMAFPLNFTRTVVVQKPVVRPQDPVEPYPYRSEEVTFGNKEAAITLAGTFTCPREGTRFPAVVLVSGSGPQNRNEELAVLNHRPFLVLSDYLTRHGIAVLRYDDRGVARSGGDYKAAGLDQFTSDARAAVAYLGTRSEVDPHRIGVVGHSEGGTIAMLLAAEPGNNLAYIVSMAGMAIPGDSLLRMQRELIARASGVSDKAFARNEELIMRVSALVAKYPVDYLREHAEQLAREILPDSLANDADFRAAFPKALEQLTSPELRSLMACDPSAALSRITCPVLALGGSKDLQVPAAINLNRIKALVPGPVTVREYPGFNHLFQPCTTGLPGEYALIDETISVEVLRDMADWIGAQRRK